MQQNKLAANVRGYLLNQRVALTPRVPVRFDHESQVRYDTVTASEVIDYRVTIGVRTVRDRLDGTPDSIINFILREVYGDMVPELVRLLDVAEELKHQVHDRALCEDMIKSINELLNYCEGR